MEYLSNFAYGVGAVVLVVTEGCHVHVAIIDAKRRITPHAVAQIIGYYSAFDITDIQPLVLILTAHQLKIVIFPFRTGEHHLINAVAFETFQLWKRGYSKCCFTHFCKVLI